MPRDGSGTYTRAVADYVAGNVVEPNGATGVNTEMDDIADALTGSLTADGSKAWGANQSGAGYWVNLLGNTRVYTTTGSANAYVITTGASLSNYTSRIIIAKLSFGNTGACTLNVDGVGATAIKIAGSDPASGDLVSGQVYVFAHDGTNWEVIAGLLLPLADIAGLARTDGGVIVGSGTNFVLESGATLRTSLGVGTGDSPQFTGIELGHATDTTLVRASAGDVNIEGNIIYRAGGTDVPVTDGGTGASTAAAARTNLDVPSNSEAVLDTLFDANTILAANTDDTPAAVTVAEDRIVGRISGGNITALTAAQVLTMLGIETFTGTPVAFNDDATLTFAHGLSGTPDIVQGYLICTTTDRGYAVDERIYLSTAVGDITDQGATVSADGTNVYVTLSSGYIVIGKSSFNTVGITEANWNVGCFALKF